MIKNKTLHINFIFKVYLKLVKNILSFQINFYFTKNHKTIFKTYFLKLFLQIITKV